MNIAQIEDNLQKLIKSFSKETFIYDLLLAYNLPKASITRLKKGNLNLSDVEGEISWKKKLFFKEEYEEDLHLTIIKLHNELKHNERFVLVTDYKTILAIDTKTDDKLDIDIKDLPKHYDFFLPWAGMEKAQHQNENPADVKAAEKMAKLFDEIKKDNPDDSPEFMHGLNVFLSRLLFCFFAEDTHIFEHNQFTNAIDSHTQPDGSDLHTYLDTLFDVLNTPENERRNLPEYLNAFPYVNGGLFKEKHQSPVFTRGSRKAILNSGDQDWSAINPDIFGSMFQAVISANQRGRLGQHYTSVPNIMKVIEPLFLNELYEEFEKAKGNQKKLNALLNRIHKIKIFDPACGSGNFLIIAYKELRILEMKIFKEGEMMALSGIHLFQFYGIEIDDFAHEIAKLALWLAEHQMNVEFFREFGRTNPTLPLKDAGKIIQGNACRLDWEVICPKNKEDEIYLLGNPPYLGQKKQNKEQKEDLKFLFDEFSNYKTLDYISCWFYKAAQYLNTNSSFAFVSTNSICQGNHVPLLWPHILNNGTNEIFFAVKNFKWTNNAKNSAGVTCSIVGVHKTKDTSKTILTEKSVISVDNINPYLINAKNIIINKRVTALCNVPKMVSGNMALDDGHLMLTESEKNELISIYPNSSKFIKETTGSKEYIQCLQRWCLWIEDNELFEALQIPPIRERVNACKKFRTNGGEVAVTLSERAHQFRYRHVPKDSQIIVPLTSSERRDYIPMGFLNKDIVIQQSA
ncbi:MAG: N-6 DNA methylase [Candidatus Theseobacter exili]|nr:N-6 DNA methylase [Candidatus Theseobacter exili]